MTKRLIDVNDGKLAEVLALDRRRRALLAERGQQRSAKIADLLIAAAAEAAGLVVLHHDRDFDLIAEVTGQPMERIVPAGTVA